MPQSWCFFWILCAILISFETASNPMSFLLAPAKLLSGVDITLAVVISMDWGSCHIDLSLQGSSPPKSYLCLWPQYCCTNNSYFFAAVPPPKKNHDYSNLWQEELILTYNSRSRVPNTGAFVTVGGLRDCIHSYARREWTRSGKARNSQNLPPVTNFP